MHKSFGRIDVLKGIDLTVAPGEVLCLVGPSGSGKSTFLRCVNHLETIDRGRLYVRGELVGYEERDGKLHELSEKAVSRRRRGIGMVFQRFNLFPHMTALENVIEAPVQVSKEPKARARERGGDSSTGSASPTRRTATPPSSPAASSSASPSPAPGHGAEADAVRRAHLRARPRTRRRGAGGDAALADDGMTMVVVTHEMGFAREVGDTLVFMDDGAVIETGPPADVLSDPRHERTRAFLSKVL